LRIVETQKKVDQGGFAASGRTDQGDFIALMENLEGKAFDDLAGRIVGEMDVFAFRVSILPRAPSLPGVGVPLEIHRVIDPFERGEGVIDFRHDVADFVERLHVVGGVGQEGGEIAD
jgi:hypothetical protein